MQRQEAAAAIKKLVVLVFDAVGAISMGPEGFSEAREIRF